MAYELVVLQGGSRDGESTEVGVGVRRMLAASAAPGLLDIYEANGQTRVLRGSAAPALVFVLVGQEPASELDPEPLGHRATEAPGTGG